MRSRRFTMLVTGVVLAAAWATGGVLVVGSGAAAEPVSPPAAYAPTDDPGWTVRATDGGFAVSWRAAEPLPVTSSQPVILLDGEPLATVVVDQRTVAATDPLHTRPRISELSVQLGGVLLDSGRRVAPRAGAEDPVVVDAGDVLDIDPAEPGPYEIATSEYDVDDLAQPGFEFPMDVRGHIVQPAAGEVAGPRPLVLFLHGRHSYCYSPERDRRVDTWTWPCVEGALPIPSMLGYDYLQRLLASQGYVTVSIDANAVNAQDWAAMDGGATARGRLVERHLQQWQQWAADGTQSVDMDQVVLVGHSRGGEGVHRAAQLTGPADAWTIAGIVHIAPVDFSQQTTSYVPTVVLLPSCDGDVYDLQGQAYTDLARDVVVGDDALHSSVLVMGANHNFFNTEWTPVISAAPSFDDGKWVQGCERSEPTRLTSAQQRRTARAYIAAATHVLTDPASPDIAALDGTPGHIASTGDHAVRVHAVGAGRDVRRVGLDARPSATTGAMTAAVCRDSVRGSRRCASSREQASPHWTWLWPRQPTQPQLHLAWTASGARGGLDLERPLDLTTAAHLDLRTIVVPGRGRPRVRVQLTDATGAVTDVVPSSGARLGPLAMPGLFAGGFAQSVRIDVADLSGIDLAQVVRVEVEGRSATGELYLLDAAAVPSAPAAAPAQRQAVVDLGSLRVQEGDDGGQVVELPWTVEGVVTEPSWFVVAMPWELQQQRGLPVQRVAVPAGSTGGTIPLALPGNEVDDARVRRLPVFARPGRGVMVRRDHGELRVLDDDPTPTASVRPRSRVVHEGEHAVVEVVLSAPTGYPWVVSAHAVRPESGEPLRVGDLRARWIRRHVGSKVPPERVFAGRWTTWVSYREPGARRLALHYPVRLDRAREGREVLVLRVRIRRLDVDRTVRFVVRDGTAG